MIYLRCILQPTEVSTRGPAVGHCWADLGSLDAARSAADAMARDGGWAVTTVKEATEIGIEEFDESELEFFRRAEAWGVYMVVYADPAEAPIRRKND